MANSTPAIKYETTQTRDMGEPAYEAAVYRDGEDFGTIEGEYAPENRSCTASIILSCYSVELDFNAPESVDSFLTIVASRLGKENARTTLARLKKTIRVAATEDSVLAAVGAMRKAFDAGTLDGNGIEFISKALD